jgi:hypothetical protein
MNCPSCGNQVKDNALFCTYCGNQLTETLKKESPNRSYKWIGIVVVLILICCGLTLVGCSGGETVSRDTSEKTPSVTTSAAKQVEATDNHIAYAITKSRYREKENLSEAVKNEFGPQATIADWSDIKKGYGGNIEEFIKEIGLKYGEDESVLVTNKGREFWSNNRHYFITRFDGSVPSGYLAHDQVQKNVIVLGSWFDINFKILVKTNKSL